MPHNEQSQRTAATIAPAAPAQDKAAMLNVEIKKVWGNLSDEEIRMRDTQQDLFFSKIKEKHGLSKEDAQKRLTEIKAAYGSSTENAA